MPDLDTKEKLDAIPGTPPNLIYPPVGDAFAERNKYAMEIDFEKEPPLFKLVKLTMLLLGYYTHQHQKSNHQKLLLNVLIV